MRFNNILFILFVTFLSVSSCKKSNSDKGSDNKNFDIYVVGTKQVDGQSYATYWKNGAEKTLSTVDSKATCIAINGRDVYIGGAVNKPTYNRGVYWKNDQLTEIPLPDSPIPAVYGVKSIVFDGSDNYIFSDYNRYTKNGVTYDYSNSTPTNAIYAKGGKLARVTNDAVGFYYREGTQPGGTLIPGAYSIGAMLLDGNDYYVAGLRVTTLNNRSYFTPGYWKNGVFEQSDPINVEDNIYIRDIAINKNGVYIVGSIVDAVKGQVPVYWHQGKINYLPIIAGGINSNARSIFLNGDDIYIAGDTKGQPCYWKNGNLVILNADVTSSQATGIALVPR